MDDVGLSVNSGLWFVLLSPASALRAYVTLASGPCLPRGPLVEWMAALTFQRGAQLGRPVTEVEQELRVADSVQQRLIRPRHARPYILAQHRRVPVAGEGGGGSPPLHEPTSRYQPVERGSTRGGPQQEPFSGRSPLLPPLLLPPLPPPPPLLLLRPQPLPPLLQQVHGPVRPFLLTTRLPPTRCPCTW